jgi:DNA-binding NarL/FixJ family response regulator
MGKGQWGFAARAGGLGRRCEVKISAVSADGDRPYRPEELTRREMEVLCHLVEGCSNKAIAQRLSIAEVTVKKHVCNIIGKLGATDRTQAAVRAVRAGLTD